MSMFGWHDPLSLCFLSHLPFFALEEGLCANGLALRNP